MRLHRDFYNRPTLRVARDLLGKFLVTRRGGRVLSAMIIEVEAYRGPLDRASHAFAGRRTPRVEALYCDGGTVYVYLCYGVHWMLNFSTLAKGKPEGVLIRGILAGNGQSQELVSGPGRVTKHLGIDSGLNGADAAFSREIWLEDRGVQPAPGTIRTGPRVGVEPAGAYWAARPWRFRIDPARPPTPRPRP